MNPSLPQRFTLATGYRVLLPASGYFPGHYIACA
jgi:hypothetical protein